MPGKCVKISSRNDYNGTGGVEIVPCPIPMHWQGKNHWKIKGATVIILSIRQFYADKWITFGGLEVKTGGVGVQSTIFVDNSVGKIGELN
jgi:hypothetical protein